MQDNKNIAICGAIELKNASTHGKPTKDKQSGSTGLTPSSSKVQDDIHLPG